MKVTYYYLHDGDPWGFFIEGHIDKEDALVAFNAEGKKLGFKPLNVDQIEHTFGMVDPNNPTDCNFVLTESPDSAAPITYVAGEYLVLCDALNRASNHQGLQ